MIKEVRVTHLGTGNLLLDTTKYSGVLGASYRTEKGYDFVSFTEMSGEKRFFSFPSDKVMSEVVMYSEED